MPQRWITKKKKNDENIHIPIKDRKPFGIPREKALINVEKLREMGKRARLIETNRKHKLYASYVATIDENGNPITENETETQKNETEEEKTLENRDYAIGVLRVLGFLKPLEDKLNITQDEINQFFAPTKDGKIHNLVEINGDYIKYLSTDESGTITIKKITPNDKHLENGRYELYYDESDNSFKFKKINPNDTRLPPEEFSYTDFGIEGKRLRIDEGKYKEIMNLLDKLDPNKKYRLFIKKFAIGTTAELDLREEDEHYLFNVDTIKVEFVPQRLVPEDERYAGFHITIDPRAFKRALTMINGIESPRPIFLDIENENHPLIIHKTTVDKTGYTNEYAYVNPMQT
jgi:hypothetical protein